MHKMRNHDERNKEHSASPPDLDATERYREAHAQEGKERAAFSRYSGHKRRRACLTVASTLRSRRDRDSATRSRLAADTWWYVSQRSESRRTATVGLVRPGFGEPVTTGLGRSAKKSQRSRGGGRRDHFPIGVHRVGRSTM